MRSFDSSCGLLIHKPVCILHHTNLCGPQVKDLLACLKGVKGLTDKHMEEYQSMAQFYDALVAETGYSYTSSFILTVTDRGAKGIGLNDEQREAILANLKTLPTAEDLFGA